MDIEPGNHSLTPRLQKRHLNTQVDLNPFLEAWGSVVKCGWAMGLYRSAGQRSKCLQAKKPKTCLVMSMTAQRAVLCASFSLSFFFPKSPFFPPPIFSEGDGEQVGRRKRRSWFSIEIIVLAPPLMAAIPHAVPKGHQDPKDPDCIQDGRKTEASTAHKILQNIFTRSSTSSNMSFFFPL